MDMILLSLGSTSQTQRKRARSARFFPFITTQNP
jgi:hypothetical protein